jgi:uncharacterized membrane protein
VPIDALRLVVGFLLLAFGLQWLRKAILRASGFKALHDEDEIFAREREEARRAGRDLRLGLDWYSFVLSFKGVLLEGLEVAFIVITFGSTQGDVPLAAAAAGAALVAVATAGVLVRAPLSRVPENTIKFAVGIMLTTFGIFWGRRGTGVNWPGGELALSASSASCRSRHSCSWVWRCGSTRHFKRSGFGNETFEGVRSFLVGLCRRGRLADRGRGSCCARALRAARA